MGLYSHSATQSDAGWKKAASLPHKDDSLGQYALPFQVSESFQSPVLGLWPEEGSVPVSGRSSGGQEGRGGSR